MTVCPLSSYTIGRLTDKASFPLVEEGGGAMVSPHLWPSPIKRVVLVIATLLVIMAYATLCSGLLAFAALFS